MQYLAHFYHTMSSVAFSPAIRFSAARMANLVSTGGVLTRKIGRLLYVTRPDFCNQVRSPASAHGQFLGLCGVAVTATIFNR